MWFRDRVQPAGGWALYSWWRGPVVGRRGPMPAGSPAGAPLPTQRRCAGDLAPAKGLCLASMISLLMWTLAALLLRYAV